MFVGNSIAAIGAGLMTRFVPSSSVGVWVGYQVLSGFGRGITQQQPILAVQQGLEPTKIPIGVAMVLFGQFFGGGVFLALADTDLSSTLISSIPEYAPSANVTAIIGAGASGVRNVVTAEQLPGVILAYNKAIDNVFVSLYCPFKDPELHANSAFTVFGYRYLRIRGSDCSIHDYYRIQGCEAH